MIKWQKNMADNRLNELLHNYNLSTVKFELTSGSVAP